MDQFHFWVGIFLISWSLFNAHDAYKGWRYP